MIVARHFHHLYDGCLLLQATSRRLHLLVALDWVRHPLWRRVIEHLCKAVDWPIMLRSERLNPADTRGAQSAYQRDEARGYMRRASAQAIQLLRQGEALVIFPEAYPVIDPVSSPRAATTVFLPFRPGFARLLAWAEKDSRTHVALVPAGLRYILQNGRWQVTLRFGPPLSRQDFASTGECIQAIEQRVRELSLQECPSVPPQASREREKTR